MVTLAGCSIMLLGAGAQQLNTEELREEVVKVETKIPTTEVKYELDRGIGRGRIVKAVHGAHGSIVRSFKVVRDATGKEIARTMIDEVRTEPTPTIFKMGSAGYQTSRGGFVRDRVLTMKSTAYDPSAGLGSRATFKTRMGLPARYGVVAVDPRVIKLGTYVFVEGYGFAYACDTGGAIKGNRIDLCVPTDAEARRWGRRTVKVHVFQR